MSQSRSCLRWPWFAPGTPPAKSRHQYQRQPERCGSGQAPAQRCADRKATLTDHRGGIGDGPVALACHQGGEGPDDHKDDPAESADPRRQVARHRLARASSGKSGHGQEYGGQEGKLGGGVQGVHELAGCPLGGSGRVEKLSYGTEMFPGNPAGVLSGALPTQAESGEQTRRWLVAGPGRSDWNPELVEQRCHVRRQGLG